MKTCNKCGVPKPLTDYYAQKGMADGHLNKCKTCTQQDSKRTYDRKAQNPTWLESEAARSRTKHQAKGYQPQAPERRAANTAAYRARYPEKYAARNKAQHLALTPGYEGHHWSYLPEHALDVIELHPAVHKKAHRYLVYDQERQQYRRSSDLVLLDNRPDHEAWIQLVQAWP